MDSLCRSSVEEVYQMNGGARGPGSLLPDGLRGDTVAPEMSMVGNRVNYGVVVVGGGHAGIEAAWAAASLGADVALVVQNPDRIGVMPCNPAIGGPGKSQMVFELQALGGVMPRLADSTAINTRVLNASRGPAVRSLRVQNDRDAYAWAAQDLLRSHDGIGILTGEVVEILSSGGKTAGVLLSDGRRLSAPAVVLCTGTFLAGVVWFGNRSREAGRQGEAPARHLSASLTATGHTLRRFSTGTPPRIRADSVDLSAMQTVPADDPPGSFTGRPGPRATSSPTWLTHTTEATHELIRANLDDSPNYSGNADGAYPRYCPSIEDKVVRFEDKDRHLLFVEPDGTDTSELYLQGFSTGLPPLLQDDLIRTLPGMEQARIQRYAYSVEYDTIDSRQLTSSLMSRRLPGLFSAGQINGTSGYEEAAVQGLIAGVNAGRLALGSEPVTLRRDQGYIGVLLDELIRWGLEEPYRMLTSRNEHRLLHRQDNALSRLVGTGVEWGLVAAETARTVRESDAAIEAERERLSRSHLDGMPLTAVMCRPDYDYARAVQEAGLEPAGLAPEQVAQLEILVRYDSYIRRSQRELEKRVEYEHLSLDGVDYGRVPSLSGEGRERLEAALPDSLGAASRLRGIRDSDVTALLVHLRQHSATAAAGR